MDLSRLHSKQEETQQALYASQRDFAAATAQLTTASLQVEHLLEEVAVAEFTQDFWSESGIDAVTDKKIQVID